MAIMYNIRLTTQPGKRDDVLALFRELADAAAGEPGTLVYTFSTVDKDPDMIVTFELFADADAVEAHKQAPAVQSVMPRLAGLVSSTDAKIGAFAFGAGVPVS